MNWRDFQYILLSKNARHKKEYVCCIREQENFFFAKSSTVECLNANVDRYVTRTQGPA